MSARDDLAVLLGDLINVWTIGDERGLQRPDLGEHLADAVMVWLDPAVCLEDEPPCPHCGGEPDDPTLHTDACPTLGTCGQTEPELDPPWHPDEDWWDGEESYSVAFRRHMHEQHGRLP